MKIVLVFGLKFNYGPSATWHAIFVFLIESVRAMVWLWHLLLKICATLRNKSKQDPNIESIKGVCQHRLMNTISFSHIFYVIKSFIIFFFSMRWGCWRTGNMQYARFDEAKVVERKITCSHLLDYERCMSISQKLCSFYNFSFFIRCVLCM